MAADVADECNKVHTWNGWANPLKMKLLRRLSSSGHRPVDSFRLRSRVRHADVAPPAPPRPFPHPRVVRAVRVPDGPAQEVAQVAAECATGALGVMDPIQRLDTIRRKSVEPLVLKP